MIESAEEFVYLRNSEVIEEYGRAANEEASLDTWQEVILRYPEMKKWVAHNKTVPLEILSILAADSDRDVRWVVATKRKLSKELQLQLAKDCDAGVRNRIAYNAKAYKEPLELLANDNFEPTKKKAIERLGSGEYG